MIRSIALLGVLAACASQQPAPPTVPARVPPPQQPAQPAPEHPAPEPPATAAAHSSDGPGGVVTGVVKDRAGAPLPGVTVATSPALPGTQAALTDAAGKYVLDPLPPGFYTLTFYFGQFVVERKDVDVKSSVRVIVDQTIEVCRMDGPKVVFSKCTDLKTACRALEVNRNYFTNVSAQSESWLTRGAGRCAHSNRCGFEREPRPCH